MKFKALCLLQMFIFVMACGDGQIAHQEAASIKEINREGKSDRPGGADEVHELALDTPGVVDERQPSVASVGFNAQSLPSDISRHRYGADIAELIRMEIATGFPDGTFKPDQPLTRAQYATLLTKANIYWQLVQRRELPQLFKDVNPGDWFNEPVKDAYRLGFMSGYADNSFKPNQQLTHQEAIVALVSGVASGDEVGDVEGVLATLRNRATLAAWARAKVALATHLGIVDDTQINPTQVVTRAQAAHYIANALRYTEHWGERQSVATPFQDCDQMLTGQACDAANELFEDFAQMDLARVGLLDLEHRCFDWDKAGCKGNLSLLDRRIYLVVSNNPNFMSSSELNWYETEMRKAYQDAIKGTDTSELRFDRCEGNAIQNALHQEDKLTLAQQAEECARPYFNHPRPPAGIASGPGAIARRTLTFRIRGSQGFMTQEIFAAEKSSTWAAVFIPKKPLSDEVSVVVKPTGWGDRNLPGTRYPVTTFGPLDAGSRVEYQAIFGAAKPLTDLVAVSDAWQDHRVSSFQQIPLTISAIASLAYTWIGGVAGTVSVGLTGWKAAALNTMVQVGWSAGVLADLAVLTETVGIIGRAHHRNIRAWSAFKAAATIIDVLSFADLTKLAVGLPEAFGRLQHAVRLLQETHFHNQLLMTFRAADLSELPPAILRAARQLSAQNYQDIAATYLRGPSQWLGSNRNQIADLSKEIVARNTTAINTLKKVEEQDTQYKALTAYAAQTNLKTARQLVEEIHRSDKSLAQKEQDFEVELNKYVEQRRDLIKADLVPIFNQRQLGYRQPISGFTLAERESLKELERLLNDPDKLLFVLEDLDKDITRHVWDDVKGQNAGINWLSFASALQRRLEVWERHYGFSQDLPPDRIKQGSYTSVDLDLEYIQNSVIFNDRKRASDPISFRSGQLSLRIRMNLVMRAHFLGWIKTHPKDMYRLMARHAMRNNGRGHVHKERLYLHFFYRREAFAHLSNPTSLFHPAMSEVFSAIGESSPPNLR